MKVLILVLSAMREPWGALMRVSKETWDAEDNPHTQTLYYCGKNGEQSNETTFYSTRYDEGLESVSPRTIEAFEEALKRTDWDFIARPNSSCYVHKKNLVSFCESIPCHDVLYGVLTEGGRGKQLLWGGCHYIISRDVIEKIVNNKEKWRHDLMDDMSLTRIAEELEIPMESKVWATSVNMQVAGAPYILMVYNHGENFYFHAFDDAFARGADGHYFYRVKQDERRHLDLDIMRSLKACLP